MLKWKRRVKVDYREGDTRIVRPFLLWPMCIQDEWRWLGLALIKQKRVRGWCQPPDTKGWSCLKWLNMEWIDGR